MNLMKLFARALLCFTLLTPFSVLPRPVAGDEPGSTAESKNPPLHHFFGFSAMEIYKIEHGIGQLRAADLNGDGRIDLAVANNRRSKIELLYQRRPDEPVVASEETGDDVNELAEPSRFRRDSVSTVWRIASLAVDDITGDKRPDLIFFGEPKELVIIANAGEGKWETPRTVRNPEGLPASTALDTGDINGDGRTDVVLLGEKHLFVYLTEEGGALARPIRYSHGGSSTRGFDLADLDGDGRIDLVTFGTDDSYPIAVRLQDHAGHLGPEQRLRLPAIRSLTASIALDRSSADLFVIQQISNRVVQYGLDSATPVRGQSDWLGLTYAFPVPGEARTRPTVIADVDGDGRSDVVAADPKTAQVIWFQQREGLGLTHGETFPGLLQITSLAAADLDDDQKDEIFMLSRDEKSIGVSRLDKGRLSFPQALPIRGEPVAFDVGQPFEDKAFHLAYVTKEKDDKFGLTLQKIDLESREAAQINIELPKPKETPSDLRFADVDQDGRLDLLVFVPYEPLTTLLQSADGKFAALSADEGSGLGLVKEAARAGFCMADVTGDRKPEVLLAQKSFARALKVANGRWTVVDQYNASGSDANIVGVCALFEDGESYPRILLYNKDKNELHTLTRRADGSYAEKASQPVGAFDLASMRVAALAGDKSPSVMLADGNRFSVLCPSRPPFQLAERSQYETKLKDTRFNDTTVGDVNHDGRTDVIVSDTAENFIHILTFDASNQLTFGTKFRVFETKQYQRGRGAAEPREMLVADVTGDRFDDLLLIAHDRILIYPAE